MGLWNGSVYNLPKALFRRFIYFLICKILLQLLFRWHEKWSNVFIRLWSFCLCWQTFCPSGNKGYNCAAIENVQVYHRPRMWQIQIMGCRYYEVTTRFENKSSFIIMIGNSLLVFVTPASKLTDQFNYFSLLIQGK